MQKEGVFIVSGKMALENICAKVILKMLTYCLRVYYGFGKSLYVYSIGGWINVLVFDVFYYLFGVLRKPENKQKKNHCVYNVWNGGP